MNLQVRIDNPPKIDMSTEEGRKKLIESLRNTKEQDKALANFIKMYEDAKRRAYLTNTELRQPIYLS